MSKQLSEPSGLLEDRADAGRRLAERLVKYWSHDVVVVGIPRGGVVVAYPIAHSLHAPLEIVVVRKVGAPFNPEFGLGAVGEGGVELLEHATLHDAGFTEAELAPALEEARQELERRTRLYRQGRSRIDLCGRTVVLVDDGVATGGSVRAAIESIRRQRPGRLVLALGVCPPNTFRQLETEVDDLVAVLVPESFFAVGQWYRDFPSVEDSEVLDILRRSATEVPLAPT
jgi:putative phosphoribosyl transferase